MDSNTSIFIRLPRLPGNTQWISADIMTVLEKYGRIKDVLINKDSRKEQFAVAHFKSWYPHCEKITNTLYKKKQVKVPAIYRKHFNLILYKQPTQNVATNTEFTDIGAVMIDGFRVPIASGISFGNPGQPSVVDFVKQKDDEFTQGRPRAQSDSDISDSDISDISDITMDEEYEGETPHYYRHYQLEEGEVI